MNFSLSSTHRSRLASLSVFALVATAASPVLAAEPPSSEPRPADSAPVRSATEQDTPSSGLMLGVSVNYAAPQLAVLSQDIQLSPGVAFGVSAGYRWRFLYLGATYQHAIFGGGTYEHESTTETATGARSEYVGIDLITLSSADAPIAFMTHQSIGYRAVTETTYINSPPASSFSRGGLDVQLFGFGIQIKATPWLRIAPEASLTIGATGVVTSIGVSTFFDFGSSFGNRPPARASSTAKSDPPGALPAD